MNEKLQKLLQQRAELVDSMRSIIDKAESERRDLSTEEITRFDSMKARKQMLDSDIAAERQNIERDQWIIPPEGTPSSIPSVPPTEDRTGGGTLGIELGVPSGGMIH